MEKLFFTLLLLTILVSVYGHQTRLILGQNPDRSYLEGDKAEDRGVPGVGKIWGKIGYFNELRQKDFLPSLSKREYYGLDTADYTESREKNGAKKPAAMKKLLPFTSMLQQLTSSVDSTFISKLVDGY